MIVFPYKTYAPVDHRPWGTLLLIAANLTVAIAFGFPEVVEPSYWFPVEEPAINDWTLQSGELDPLAWITSAFIHGGRFDLIGNMVFLWSFGLLVEGLAGWKRLIPFYLAVAFLGGGIDQILMLGREDVMAYGSSGARYGLMAAAALWTPRNRLKIFLWILLTVRTPEVTVRNFALVFIGVNVALVCLSGFTPTTALMHTVGAVLGFGIALLMLRRGWVDCGGWDLFSLRRKDPRWRLPGFEDPGGAKQTDPRLRALILVRKFLEAGEAGRADDAYTAGQRRAPGWILRRSDLLALIRVLLGAGPLERGIERMEEFLGAYGARAAAVRLTLANHLLHAGRPARALEHLERLDESELTEVQCSARFALRAKALVAGAAGGLELE